MPTAWLSKTGEHWPLLLAQLQIFLYVYPEAEGRIPAEVMEGLLDRARSELRRGRSGEAVTRGTLISRFSFTIDVNEWGLRDVRRETICEAEQAPILAEIANSDVWDEKSPWVDEFFERIGKTTDPPGA